MKELTIVQMNDTHAYFELHPELFWAGKSAKYRPAGGYARISALLRQLEDKEKYLLALDCGDTIHGTFAAVESEGQALVPILQQLPFTAMTAHWEFAYGPQRLQEVAAQIPYPLLAANCYDEESNERVFEPYTIHETGSLRVGIVGLAAYIVDKVMPDSFSKGIRMTLGLEELPQLIKTLRQEEKADLVVVISHLGFPQEMQLAQDVDGIDVLLSAHTHNRLWAPVRVNDTLVMQSGSHGAFLGALAVQVEQGRVIDFRHRLLMVDEPITPDPIVAEIVDAVLGPHRDLLNEVVGETRTALNRATVLESTTDNFLLQSLLHVQDAHVAFSHGWRYGAPVPAGPVTREQLYNIVPMNPALFTIEMSGEEIWTMLEQNLEQVFARNPYEQVGGNVKRCLGLNGYIKFENPAGRRLQELFIRGEKVQPDRSYSAVFITTQGVPEQFGHNRQKLDVRAVEAMERYLQEAGPARAERQDTFTAI
ncbi:MAG TPA: bifunctional metallophosphatase/5'-nucleotidase [Candidatus Sulfomarinibacteraceae bacterium]|nr:bifunctional metallophosphatase/5'-nucleotidase [Candidatus Sulfomarinibacteraceae bacterium]